MRVTSFVTPLTMPDPQSSDTRHMVNNVTVPLRGKFNS